MTIASDAMLTSARTALERLHVTSATHGRLTETVSASGGTSRAWTSQGSISCRVESGMGDTRQGRAAGSAPGDRVVHEYAVFVAHDADIRHGDRLTLAAGIVLSVEQSSRAQSQPLVQALYCTEVTA
jgi:hypothetical protein